MALLEVSNLTVEYGTQQGAVQAVNDISFEIEKGERMGLVGESGCGKTTVAKSIMRLLPDNGHITEGEIRFTPGDINEDLATADQAALRDLRWEDLAMIAQSAMNALDPVYTIGEQIVEAIQLHRDDTKKDARSKARGLLDSVGIDPDRVNSYPHQLSGGMCQRAIIAMAMALEPALTIADEPTTALDVVTQDHILDQISKSIDHSLLIITHDISVVAETCDKVAVMYAGELVEVGATEQVFTNPEHPYTQGLLNAFPSLDEEESELVTIQGEPPDLSNPPSGCSFYDRCPYSEPRCRNQSPPLTPRDGVQKAACFVTEDGYNIQTNYEKVLTESEKWQKL